MELGAILCSLRTGLTGAVLHNFSAALLLHKIKSVVYFYIIEAFCGIFQKTFL